MHKYLNILKYGRYMNIPSHPHIKHIFSKGYLCRPPPHPKKDLVPPTSTNLFLSCKIASSDRGVPAESTTLYIIHGSWLGNVYIYLIFKIVHPLNVFIYIHIYRYSLSNAIYHRHWQDSLGRGGGGGWGGGIRGGRRGRGRGIYSSQPNIFHPPQKNHFSHMTSGQPGGDVKQNKHVRTCLNFFPVNPPLGGCKHTSMGAALPP